MQYLSKMDLYQLAAKAGKRVSNVHSAPTATGMRLYCRLNGVRMLATDARLSLIAEIQQNIK